MQQRPMPLSQICSDRHIVINRIKHKADKSKENIFKKTSAY